MTKSLLLLSALFAMVACGSPGAEAPPARAPTSTPAPAPPTATPAPPEPSAAPRATAPVEAATKPGLRIYHIDVEQGDATLFVAPGGGTLLVDAGGPGYGERIKALLKELGVNKIDYFVATHYDEEHIGGIADVLADSHVVQAFDRGGKARLLGKTKFSKAYQSYTNAIGNVAEPLVPGDRITLDPDMTVTCLASGGAAYGVPYRGEYRDEGDLGIALLVKYGDFRYFIGGDLRAASEQKVLDSGLGSDVDVYRADDHGSAEGSSESFLRALAPSVVIISNGDDPDQPRPTRATLDGLAALPNPPTVFQTNKLLHEGTIGGNVVDAFIADPKTRDADGTILVSVDAAGGKYAVSYGSQSRSFDIRPSARADAKVVIASLLPDPAGSDKELEEVSIENKSKFVVDVSRWVLKNRDGDVWSLVKLGTLGPNSKKTVARHGMRMSLNNTGDQISLVDDSGQVVDSFEYTESTRGKRISTGH